VTPKLAVTRDEAAAMASVSVDTIADGSLRVQAAEACEELYDSRYYSRPPSEDDIARVCAILALWFENCCLDEKRRAHRQATGLNALRAALAALAGKEGP
jgi:hypothetical protein